MKKINKNIEKELLINDRFYYSLLMELLIDK